MALQPFKVGVISDTHSFLDPRVKEIFADVDHIIHAGDIGMPYLILDLQDIAPVTAVLGNNDNGLEFRETEMLELRGRKFLVHHIIDPDLTAPPTPIKRKIIRDNPDVVIFGHTHKPFCETIANTLYFNPGYAGKPSGQTARSVAILHCDDSGITAEFTAL